MKKCNVLKKCHIMIIIFIERPLLVHRTKVDIRQWFLITSTQPLIVWIFKYFAFYYLCNAYF